MKKRDKITITCTFSAEFGVGRRIPDSYWNVSTFLHFVF